ncbi:hypothetical protein [Streptomyces sp. NPDC050982]|uniref:hypothetical protein n=1 Tax=Streptomyces sp. NPDC050982 TaxID=3154746 RepID=UPI0033DD06E0
MPDPVNSPGPAGPPGRRRPGLPPRAVAELGRFLEAAHLAYGLTDVADPQALRIGLYDSLHTADIERLLGLLDFLLARLAQATEPDQEGR